MLRRSCLAPPGIEAIDQSIGGCVVPGGWQPGLELGQDAPGERLAELDAPLVVGVDVPDHALDEDLVLVERDQRAERGRIEPLAEDGSARAVAFEDTVRREATDLVV